MIQLYIYSFSDSFPLYFITRFFKKVSVYLFLALLGLCCSAGAFSSCGEWGLLFVVVLGLLIAVASLLPKRGFGSCDPQPLLFRGVWDLPGPGIECVFPAMADRFLTDGPPGITDLTRNSLPFVCL